ncbi:MAG: FAD-dependent oxidoreductase [Acidimicrobiia bacterium]|nr:FAD-dependent oxidoreductase [Acidimicrobiia bacterium]
MHTVVIGAGPAGLTAAHTLRGRGHRVTVLEAETTAGGRTHSEHFGKGHWNDTGAGWLASFYPETLGLLAELRETGGLRPMRLRGGGDLLLDGDLHPAPNSLARVLGTGLLGPGDKARFLAYMAALMMRQRGDLQIDMAWDGIPALDTLAPAGRAAIERVVRPTFEGPFFSRLEEMSGALVRSWMRAIATGRFFQVDGGMDAPWRRLAASLDVRTGVRVESVREGAGWIEVVTPDGSHRYDTAVVAVPASVAARLAPEHAAAPVLSGIRYAPHVRLYAARRGEGPPRSGTHAFPNDTVATVELSSGRGGAWGHVPDHWEWLLVCAPAATSAPLLDLAESEACSRLWDEAARIDPRIFGLGTADVVHLVRWEHAVPVVDTGYFSRLRELSQRPPIVFCGDWLVQPCVEGAVRSGRIAAAVLT